LEAFVCRVVPHVKLKQILNFGIKKTAAQAIHLQPT